jgi:hypothetical protein
MCATKTGAEKIPIDETLPIKNKPKHPEKGGIQGTKWKDPCPSTQKNHLRGEHQVLKAPLIVRSI